MASARTPTTRPPRRPSARFGREDLQRLDWALAREWLETDGAGGYAASTVLLCPTRRQHGLLVAPYPGNPRRHVFLSRFEESVELEGREGRSFPLSIARYPSVWAPHGHLTLDAFEHRPHPSWTHRIGDAVVRRDLLLVRGRPTVLVRWTLVSGSRPARFSIRPLLACRDADAVSVENMALEPRVERLEHGVRCQPYSALPPVSMTVSARRWRFDAAPTWFRRTEFSTDLARGYEGHDDQFSPGFFTFPVEPGEAVTVAVTISDPAGHPAVLFDAEVESRLARRPSGKGLRATLAAAADDYLWRSPSGRLGVIAGFPWFSEWGRDTFISLPGLLLSRGKVEECGAALSAAVPWIADGLLPNRFGASRADSDYASADAALWFARAVRLYDLTAREVGGPSRNGARERLLGLLRPALAEIARGYEAGTRFGIGGDGSGLVRLSDPAGNLTWMDAKADGVPVTPRHGCPVEIAALWCFLLRYLADLHLRAGDPNAAAAAAGRAERAERAFLARLWLPDRSRLADAWREGGPDPTIRPNMVIAASLEWSPLSREQRKDVVLAADARLVTPRGLRTLDPRHPEYCPRYEGGVLSRDRAYHQGTVWPWLCGAYVEATLRAYGAERPVVSRLAGWLDGFEDATTEMGLGHVAEVYDGDPPHRAGGAFAQAWSVAELLRAYDLLDRARP